MNVAEPFAINIISGGNEICGINIDHKDFEDVLDMLLAQNHGQPTWNPVSPTSATHGIMHGNHLLGDNYSPDCSSEPDNASVHPDFDIPALAIKQWEDDLLVKHEAVTAANDYYVNVESGNDQRPQKLSWAGLTLGHVESALAIASSSSSSTTNSPSSNLPAIVYSKYPISSPSSVYSSASLPSSYSLSSNTCSTYDNSYTEKQPTWLSDALTHPTSGSCFLQRIPRQLTQEEDENLAAWRNLQKRNHLEPRYTLKIRSDKNATSDGYRWRKYGQKAIKNSPYPRSYYRCSSGKCRVKKQVERSIEDEGLLLVTYEGIHLHHRPNLFQASNTARTYDQESYDQSIQKRDVLL